MHVFVWGSILVWFVAIPITSSGTLYGSFFQYSGVAYEVIATANFWFYLPLATVIALTPTMVSRLITLYRYPTYIDFVRLKEKKAGRRIFKRKNMTKRSRSARSVKRTGYAFSHMEGFGKLITSGHIFGMNRENVAAEHSKRYSQIMSTGRAESAPPISTSTDVAAQLAASSISAAQLVTKQIAVDVYEAEDSVVRDMHAVSVEVVEESEIAAATSLGSDVREDKERLVSQEIELNPYVGDEVPTASSLEEQTDSALPVMPSVRIPGLVDSPKDRAEGDLDLAEVAESAKAKEEGGVNNNDAVESSPM